MIVIAISLWTIIAHGQRLRFDAWRLMLVLVWAALALRLMWDSFFAEISGAVYALQFFFAAVLMPSFALWALRDSKALMLASFGFWFCVAGSLFALLGSFFSLFGQADLTEITGRLSTVALNPVSLAHLAVSGILCGLAIIRKSGLILRMITIGVIALLLIVIALCGSKGPALALLVCLLIWAFQRRLLIWAALWAIPIFIAILFNPENPLTSRILFSDKDLSTVERLEIIKDSINQIIEYPILGSSSIEFNSGFYSHNVVLEAPMAFGIPIAIVFYILLLRTTFIAIVNLRGEYDFLALLFLQGLIGSLVGGGLFGAAMMWIPLTLLICHPKRSQGLLR